LSECGRVGRAVLLEHLVRVAVVGGDESTPPASRTARTTSPRHASTASHAGDRGGIEPVWPTMSALAKLMTPNAARPRPRATNASAAGARAHLGLWS
jgi:hypothetical protein